MRRAAKRTIDLTVSSVGLLVLLPIYITVAFLLLVVQGRPILHASTRAGRYLRPFPLLKYRTMNNRTDANGNLLDDSERITRIGRILRASSLDEIPQLLNILCGQMSLVGPRPLPMAYIERYSSYESRRSEVRPGLTGLAQVRGRNATSWQRRFAYDVTYVERWTWRLELLIMIETFTVVLARRGVSNGEHATMPEFVGTTSGSTRQYHSRHTPTFDTLHRTLDVRQTSAPSGLEILAVELEKLSI